MTTEAFLNPNCCLQKLFSLILQCTNLQNKAKHRKNKVNKNTICKTIKSNQTRNNRLNIEIRYSSMQKLMFKNKILKKTGGSSFKGTSGVSCRVWAIRFPFNSVSSIHIQLFYFEVQLREMKSRHECVSTAKLYR